MKNKIQHSSNDRLDILVLFGGQSPEHEVSRNSAAFIADTLSEDQRNNVILLGITKNGEWKYFEGSSQEMRDGSWEDSPTVQNAFLTVDSSQHRLYFPDNEKKRLNVDVVFPVLHGANGEDGRLQGMLEMANIPFVGCGMLASALAMDKAYSNQLFDLHRIPQSKWCSVDRMTYQDDVESCLKKCIDYLGLPIFVKPANTGSSIGINRADTKQELRQAIEEAFKYDNKIVIEKAVHGRELEISALGTSEDLFLSVIGEIIPHGKFYDYTAKYEDSESELIIPADLKEEEIECLRKYAAMAFKALSCYGMARIDFFLSDDGDVLLNEINTIPGFVEISMYPKLLEASGIKVKDLLDKLIELSFKRYLHGK